MPTGIPTLSEFCPTYPPKPRVALSIGIIGHRPDRLPAAGLKKVAAEIGRVLDLIVAKVAANHKDGRSQQIFSDADPSLTIISALAEGADRMGAQAGWTRRMKLHVVLPFTQAEYANDFVSEESKAEFDDLLGSAHVVLVLPGVRHDAPKSYEAAGLTLLDQSDIVIAVWDGEASRGRGGTPALVDAAARYSVPVIHVDASGAKSALLRWAGLDKFPINAGALSDVPHKAFADDTAAILVDRLLRVPSAPLATTGDAVKQKEAATSGGGAEQREDTAGGSRVEQEALTRYFNRGFFRLNRGFSFAVLQTIFCAKCLGRGDFRLERPADASENCAGSLSRLGIGAAIAPAANAYGFSDAIAIRHAHMFRSSFVSNFVLAAGAVVCAVLSIVFMDLKKPLTFIEIILLSLLVSKTIIGKWRNWHSSWLEAREVAERLRASLPLWTLGARPASYRGDESTWTGWYVRAILRELGMRPGALDADETAKARNVLRAVIADQTKYHRATAKRMERLEHRMEWFGLILLALTFLLGVGYLLAGYLFGPVPKDWGLIVAALSAAFPAIASASYGIRVIGEFEGIKQRSQRTQRELGRLRKAIADDRKIAPADIARLRARAQATADVLLGDVVQWRVAAESRALAIPG